MLHTHYDLQCAQLIGGAENFPNRPLGDEDYGKNVLCCVSVYDDVDPIVNGICFLVLLLRRTIP